MRPALHIAFSLPVAAAAAYYGGSGAAALFAAGAVLIDLDHVIMYYQRTGDLHPARLLRWFKRVDQLLLPGEYFGLSVFHAVEFFIIIAAASWYVPLCWWLFSGMVYHMILDYIGMILHPVYGIHVRSNSWIEHLIRRKKEHGFWERVGADVEPPDQPHYGGQPSLRMSISKSGEDHR